MPKKKLTKAQVKRKFLTASNAFYDLITDKMGHADSKVPISFNKLVELHRPMLRALTALRK